MTVSVPLIATRVERLRGDLVEMCCAVAECEGVFRQQGWAAEADLFLDLFEAFEGRMVESYTSGEASFSSGS
jgi:hypothetical protein